jgi:Ca-activated chloride channel family protein
MKLMVPMMLGLWVLLPVFYVLLGVGNRTAGNRVRMLVADRLRSLLVAEAGGRRARMHLVLWGLGFGVLALARPQWGELKEDRKGYGRDVIIAVDVSRSMLASDLPPSRLKRAKLAAEDLVRQLPGDRVGLVAFAGSSFLQAPVTSDHAAVITAIHELDTDLIPLPGTNVAGAIRCAEEAFSRAEGGQRALILITDGEDLEADGVAVAKEVAGKVRIFTVGVGTPEGAVLSVPSPRGGVEYIRDETGNVVQSRLDEKCLRELAEAGGGFYTRLVSGPAEMRAIVQNGITSMEQHEVMQEGQVRAVERYQWPLGVAIGLIGVGLLLGERRGKSAARLGTARGGAGAVLGLLVVWLGTAGMALAQEGAKAVGAAGSEGSEGAARADRAENTGRALFDSGKYAESSAAYKSDFAGAPRSAEKAYNWGVAAYKSGNWPEAIQAFGAALALGDDTIKSKAEYNLANTLVQQARQGRRGVDKEGLESAIAHYEEALRQNPRMEDASHNREVVRRLLEQKEQKPPQKSQKGKGEKKDSKNPQDGSEKQDQGAEKGDSSSGEKQDSEEGSGEGKEGQQGKDGSQKKQGKDGKSGGDPNQGSNENRSQDGKREPGKDGQAPQPVEEKAGDAKARGKLQNDPVPGEGGKNRRDGKESAGEAELTNVGDGKLTKEQAAALVEALRSEDRRVQLWTPNDTRQKPARGREMRTW